MDLLRQRSQQLRFELSYQESRIQITYIFSKSCQMYLHFYVEIFKPPFEIQEVGWG